MSFNEAQLSAINHNTGPAIVLAGPGSGKTTVITMRTKNLIENHRVLPSHILVITFTKMAANEMKERFHRLMGEQHVPVTFGTFHAVFFTILKYAYNYNASNIIREDQQRELVKALIIKYKIEVEDENEFVSSILGEISRVKGDMLDVNLYYSINCSEGTFRDIYRDYEKSLRHKKLIDFDDMLVYCYELLSQRKDILEAWQNKYRYILIDEFQDINLTQYKVVKLLAEKTHNIFIVGDDDQSIYGFRGAKPDIMLNFTKEYSDAAMIKLDINYRSSENIVNAAKRVIDKNTRRFYKDIKTANPKGTAVSVKGFADTQQENMYVIDCIRNHVGKGVKYGEIAVLSRTNISARQLLGKLIEYNVPFVTRDAVPSLYDHWIARNIFSYIKIALGNRDRSEFLQIMNKPKRYISRDSLTSLAVDFEELMKLYEDKNWMIERIENFESDLNLLKNMNPFAAVNYIRRGIGYDEYLKEYANDRRINVEDLFNVLSEIQEMAREFNSFQEWFDYIDNYNSEFREHSQNQSFSSDAVTICTMHSSKGLEYRIVFIIDVNEGMIPYNKAVLDSEIEEERRMFYVAMTRAKEELNILYTEERYNKKQEKSRFLEDV